VELKNTKITSPKHHIRSTNATKQRSSSSANTSLASQEITRVVWDPNVHYRVHKTPSLIPVLSHTQPVLIIPASLLSDKLLYYPNIYFNMAGKDRNSSVCIPTRYGLDVPRIESRWRRDFPHKFRPIPMGTGVFPSVKWPGCGVDHPPLYRRDKERVELYFHSRSRPWCLCQG
jgi:hypothetical protein